MSLYTAAFGLGFVAGLRSQTPLALLSQDAVGHPDRVADTPFRILAQRPVAALLTLGSVGEVVIDKLPNVPDRLSPGPLLGRLAFGALAGAVVWAEARRPLPVGAGLGAVGGFLGSHAGYRLRGWLTGRLKLPALAGGLIEDGLAFALGRYFLPD